MFVDSPAKPSRWRKHLWWLVTLAFPLLTGFGAPYVVDSAYTPSLRVRVGEIADWRAEDPSLSATAALLYDVDTDEILFAEHILAALPPASLTKLMTALLVLEAGNLQAEVVVQLSDLVGGASMGLVPGEVITVEELLWGLLIPSGNDAATVLARHTGGSVASFVELMNTQAATLGLAQTHFANPHGLDADGHLSSVADMLTLVRRNWESSLFREIVGTAQTTVNGHFLLNTNQLLDTYSGTIGVKTGTTDAAGQCLIASFQREGHQVIGIVFGSSDRYADMRALHGHYLDTYQWVIGDSQGLSALNRLYGQDGKLWYLRPEGTPPTELLRAVEHGQLVPFRRISPPAGQSWQVGMQVGVIEWRLHNVVKATQSLVLW